MNTSAPKHLQPLSPQTIALLDQKGMDKNSPILLRIFKEESELEIWKQARDGRFALLRSYPICRWSGELGPKIREGDRQAPEGFYAITPELMNPWSNYHLAFNLGFPNEFDRAHGRTGSHLMVHGACSSAGCYSMTDEQISEIFALAREAFDGGQLAFQVHAFPFRMTGRNLARHRANPNMPFWRMLKEGNDHFEVTKRQPKIDVCDRRYIFNAHLVDPSQPVNPTGPCPEYQVPQSIATAVAEKRAADERQFKLLANLGIPAAPVVTGRDGGSNAAFASRVPQQQGRQAVRRGQATATGVTGSTSRRATASTPRPSSSPRQPASTTASASTGDASRQQMSEVSRDDAPTDVTESGSASASQAQERESPRPLPGATPILSTGGFSFR